MALKSDLRQLLETSPALSEDPSEQWYWLSILDSLSDEALVKLHEVLQSEQAQVEAVLKKQSDELDHIDAQHLKALENFKRRELPRYLKQWESATRHEENPDQILNELSNE